MNDNASKASNPGQPHRILCMLGARPNFMPMVPIMQACAVLAPRVADWLDT